METPPAVPRTNVLGSELLNATTLYTLAGATAGVWVVCLVVSGVAPPRALDGLPMRLIAIGMSIAIMLVMLFTKVKKAERTPEQWMLCFLNAGLIWLNTSGMTSVSRNIFQASTPASTAVETSAPQQAGFSFNELFSGQADWWPEQNSQQEVARLAAEKERLAAEVRAEKGTAAALRDSVGTVQRSWERASKELGATKEELAMARKLATTGQRELMDRVAEYRNTIVQLDRTVELAHDSISVLEGTVATTRTDLERATASIGELSAELNVEKARSTMYAAQLQETSTKLKEYAKMRRMIEE